MEKRLALILANLFLCVGIAFAQMQVTGTVVSQDDNEPVVGASIMVVGTNTGTVTDITRSSCWKEELTHFLRGYGTRGSNSKSEHAHRADD